jgi:replicative DNA helicase
MSDNATRDIIYTPNEVGNIVVAEVQQRRANPGAGVRSYIKPLDEHLLPLRPGELVVIIGRTSNYKSGLMQYWARNIAQDIEGDGEMVVYVTWEMAVEELGLYDLAASACLNASDIAQGRVSDDAWERLQIAAMQRAAIPLWLIGHSVDRRKKRPDLTLSNVGRALRLIDDEMNMHPRAIFLDYLGQMQAEKGEDRRMQTFENVRRCKDMALALGCPVILGVQAGRQMDGREWKLPEIGDGQECLAGDVLLMDAATGMVKPIAEWEASEELPRLHVLDDSHKLYATRPLWIKKAGMQTIYRLRTKNGMQTRASGNHPFLTPEGWRYLQDIRPGDYVAVARRLAIGGGEPIGHDRALLIGLMLGDGSYTDGRTPAFCCGRDKQLCERVGSISQNEFGTHTTWFRHYSGAHQISLAGPINVSGQNGLITWLRGIEMYGQRHDNATVPNVIFHAPDEEVAAFLRGLFATDGSFPKPTHPSSPVVYLASVSYALVRTVQLLLLRLGIESAIRANKLSEKATQICYHCLITGYENVRTYMEKIGFEGGVKGERIAKIWEATQTMRSARARSQDLFPSYFCYQAIEKAKASHIRLKFNMVKGRGICRSRLNEVASATGDPELRQWADSDVRWLKVLSVEEEGREMTYDVSIPPDHNFVADGFIVHNTSNIEQTADKVISVWLPKTSEPIGSILRLPGGKGPEIQVTDNLLVIGLKKQRLGPANKGVFCYADVAKNDIKPLAVRL